MKIKTIIPFAVAVVLAGVAVHLGKGALHSMGGGGKTIKVVVASKDLDAGYQIKASDVTTAEMPVSSAPSGATTKPADVIGQVISTTVWKGQTIVKAAIAPEGAGMRLQAQVPPGMRAVTMEVNEFSGVAGLLFPGCHVDIISTIIDEQTHHPVAKPIVQNAKVTAVGQKMAAKSNSKELINASMKSVTMVMTARDAAALDLASSKGRPRLVLRGQDDEKPVGFARLTLAELVGEQIADDPGDEPSAKPQAANKPSSDTAAEQPFEVQIIQGGSVSEMTFDLANPGKPAQISSTKSGGARSSAN